MGVKINIWAERHNQYDIASNFLAFYQLIDKWIVEYPHITFERKNFLPPSERKNINNYALEDRKLIHNGWNSVFHFIIENESTRKYFLVSYWDSTRQTDIEFKGYDYKNLVELFTGQGSHDPDLNLKEDTLIKYTPINKVLWLESSEKEIEKVMGTENFESRVIPDKLHFRVGDPYSFRTYLIRDSRFNTSHGDRIPESQHIHELNKNWINMDVYSISGVSMRLIESMGLNTAVLSPKFPQRVHSPIIPNYHYVEVEFDEPNLDPSNFKKLADSYIDTFEKLKKDPDRIHYIAKNAREYYLENCTIEKHVDNLYKLIDLNKLI
jgi:hypothetical protein